MHHHQPCLCQCAGRAELVHEPDVVHHAGTGQVYRAVGVGDKVHRKDAGVQGHNQVMKGSQPVV